MKYEQINVWRHSEPNVLSWKITLTDGCEYLGTADFSKHPQVVSVHCDTAAFGDVYSEEDADEIMDHVTDVTTGVYEDIKNGQILSSLPFQIAVISNPDHREMIVQISAN